MAIRNLMGNYRNANEQDLVANLVEEAIDQRGVEVRYILRDMLNPDYLLGESTMSQFTESYPINMYVESIEHFNGNGDVFDAFGLNITDNGLFQVGARRFKTTIGVEAELERPREGDLIYLPYSDSLWEITKVKMDQKYYQLGKNYSYRLVTKLFTYSHEEIDTGADVGEDFNEYTNVNVDGLKEILGVTPDSLKDETEIVKKEVEPIESFDPNNFSF